MLLQRDRCGDTIWCIRSKTFQLFIVLIPRMWECIVDSSFNALRTDVYPTYVGMCRVVSSWRLMMESLSHVCGNVSFGLQLGLLHDVFIPRMWECLDLSSRKLFSARVYPTHAGMSRKRRGRITNCMRLSHVCGNGSKAKFKDKRDDLKAEQIMPRFFHTLCRSITFFLLRELSMIVEKIIPGSI